MRKSRITKRLVSLSAFVALFTMCTFAPAAIFQWTYVNPSNPELGKQQSTTLCPDGSGANPLPGADLAHRNLAMAYLTGSNLAGANLTSAGLVDAELSQANLVNAYLGGYWESTPSEDIWHLGANLSGANLKQADLRHTSFYTATLLNADFRLANLSSASFYSANMTGANLTGADVRGANFARDALPYPIYDWAGGITLTQLYSTASYQAGDLNGIGLQLNDLANGILVGQNLANADFSFATLTGANLSGADARGANFHAAALTGANTNNMIKPNGQLVGLDLTAGTTLVVRDYDGNPAADPPTGPLPIAVEQHFAMGATGVLRMVFDADPWNSTISFAPGIPVARGGTLELTFAPDVSLASQLGRTIDLFDWTGVTPTGSFTVTSPYTWNLTNLYTTGEVTLTAWSPGDFSGNGIVDAADYVLWRNRNGAPNEDADWRSHFGQHFELPAVTGGSASTTNSSGSVIPEPTSLAIILFAAAGSFLIRGKSCAAW